MARNFYSWREDPTIMPPAEGARQGAAGHNVRRVLGWSLTGALVVVAAALSLT